MNNRKYYASAIAAFLIWGFFPWVLKSLVGYRAGEILYFRILFSTIVLLAIVLIFRNRKLRKDLSQFGLVPTIGKVKIILLWVAGGALLTINWLTFIYTVNFVNIRTASFSYLICPVLTAVLGYTILNERLTALQWIAVLLCAISCVLMGLNSVSELGYSMITAFTYGLYLVLQRLYKEYDRMTVLIVQILFSFSILSIARPYLVAATPTETSFYVVIIVIAAAFTVLPLFLNLYALVGINSATVGILMYINPLINFTIAFVIFHEQVSELQIIGYGIIAIALGIFNYPNFQKLQALRVPR